MADLDEAPSLPGQPAEEVDISDEQLDYRFLTTLSKPDAKVPKRGEKDFEPHSTDLQANTLAASRQAMHDALSYPRVHAPKRSNIAVYHAESNTAYLDAPKSTLFKSMGSTRAPATAGDLPANANRLWLLPEEVLYLVERGTVDCRWPSNSSATNAADGEGEPGRDLPMSVQGAHAVFLGLAPQTGDGLTFARYSVYAYLRRAGYAVHRAETWERMPEIVEGTNFAVRTWGLGLGWPGFWARSRGDGPLVGGGRWRSYPDIYRALAVVPWHDPTRHYAESARLRQQDLRITWNVWKPSNTTYKKSKPGPPDFQIAVVDARDTNLPSLADLAGLMDTVPYSPPPDGMPLYAKLKHGYKSVILAVVDQGVTSFIRLSDAASGREQLYNRIAK
ncbi:hypothetical protein K461DRAFT_247373, partial [Myriangium duriaei CBS 260.36]